MKLSQLFDMQKIVENKALAAVIEDTHNRYNDNIIELSDCMLEFAAAGVKENSDDNKKIWE